MSELTQKELEQPAKVYQIEGLRKDVHNFDSKLDIAIQSLESKMDTLLNNTKGVVTFDQMKQYVAERIKEDTKELWLFKKNAVKLGWLVAVLLLADIATRILK